MRSKIVRLVLISIDSMYSRLENASVANPEVALDDNRLSALFLTFSGDSGGDEVKRLRAVNANLERLWAHYLYCLPGAAVSDDFPLVADLVTGSSRKKRVAEFFNACPSSPVNLLPVNPDELSFSGTATEFPPDGELTQVQRKNAKHLGQPTSKPVGWDTMSPVDKAAYHAQQKVATYAYSWEQYGDITVGVDGMGYVCDWDNQQVVITKENSQPQMKRAVELVISRGEFIIVIAVAGMVNVRPIGYWEHILARMNRESVDNCTWRHSQLPDLAKYNQVMRFKVNLTPGIQVLMDEANRPLLDPESGLGVQWLEPRNFALIQSAELISEDGLSEAMMNDIQLRCLLAGVPPIGLPPAHDPWLKMRTQFYTLMRVLLKDKFATHLDDLLGHIVGHYHVQSM